jgi:hypothetical protein
MDSRYDYSPESLARRAQKIDPRTAVCFDGYYGEEFPLGDGDWQRQVSRTVVWSDGYDSVPDWAMKDAWPEFSEEWEKLQVVAWERDSMRGWGVTEPPEVDAILALNPTSEVLIRALYRTLALEGVGNPES